MDPQDDNFDLIVDSVPPGTLQAVPATPVSAAQPPAPPAHMPQAPAAPLAAPVVYVPSVPEPPPAKVLIRTPPKRTHRGTFIGILLVLIAINGAVVAHFSGLLSAPDLTSSGNKSKSVTPVVAEAKKPESPAAPKTNESTPNDKATNPAKKASPAQPAVQPPVQPAVQPPTVKAPKQPATPPAGKPAVQPPAQPKVQPPPQPQPQLPQAKPRPFKSTRDVLTAVQTHMLKVPEEDRKFQRYFTLAPLYNDPGISDKQLEEYRAALTSLVSYLQPTKKVRIEPIDPAKVVLCLDLRTAGWDAPTIWLDVLKQYPYGLVYSEAKDLETADLGKDIAELSTSDVPLIRLDWFLHAAGRGALSVQLGPPEESSELPPAIIALNKRYLQDVTLEQAARELGLTNASQLRGAVQTSELLRNRGLAPFLVNSGAVSRAVWSSLTRGTSACQEAGLQLGLGSVYADIR